MGQSGTTTAFAPASVGNVGVGFDVLGHALAGVGDEVALQATAEPGVHLTGVTGVVDTLPDEPPRNTALRPLMDLRADFSILDGVVVRIKKGIPLGSGMGGSAASAVASVVAANALWDLRLDEQRLLHYALAGEAVASGDVHADNVAPSLIGGLVLCETQPGLHVTPLQVPAVLSCVLVHPDLAIATRAARELLADAIPMALHVRQSQSLAGFIAGCQRGDLDQIQRLIETGEPLSPESLLVPGDVVRVKNGSFAGFEGTVVHRQNETRLLVAVNFMQQGASVLLQDCQLEYLRPPTALGNKDENPKGSIDVVYNLRPCRHEITLRSS